MSRLTDISRRSFLLGLASCAAAAVSGKLIYDSLRARAIPCRMLGPSMALGHSIRDGKLVSNSDNVKTQETKVTIIGGGIAGLSAGWWLKKQGFFDFTILEMEKQVGGNSSFGQNSISSYPWGAHYIPLANKESQYVRMLFEDLNVIQGTDALSGLPVYNDLYMCHDPEERLLKDGSFQEGLIPKRGLQEFEKKEMTRFFNLMETYREAVGSDGMRAFAIPVDLSSQDEEFLSLDKISMSDWLDKNQYKSKALRWYLNYCCRDDYGASCQTVSAWAAIHYFAGRHGRAANAEMNSVVTWPQGNGFVVEKLKEILQDHIQTGTAVVNVLDRSDSVSTSYFDQSANALAKTNSTYAICAAPRFIAKHLIGSLKGKTDYADLVYAPWMVANISLRGMPEAKGVGLAWDNVSYVSKSLGYVVATHQKITTQRNQPLVITYYYPMAEWEPLEARKLLTTMTASQWSDKIILDLEKMHPGIKNEMISIDLWPWGHGMIRPSVGFIWSETRKQMKEPSGNVYFAHSDMSGISNFEEAQYHGVQAAKQVLEKLAWHPT